MGPVSDAKVVVMSHDSLRREESINGGRKMKKKIVRSGWFCDGDGDTGGVPSHQLSYT